MQAVYLCKVASKNKYLRNTFFIDEKLFYKILANFLMLTRHIKDSVCTGEMRQDTGSLEDQRKKT